MRKTVNDLCLFWRISLLIYCGGFFKQTKEVVYVLDYSLMQNYTKNFHYFSFIDKTPIILRSHFSYTYQSSNVSHHRLLTGHSIGSFQYLCKFVIYFSFKSSYKLFIFGCLKELLFVVLPRIGHTHLQISRSMQILPCSISK